MQSDRQLLLWYRKFNKLYWNGELPDNTVIHWEPCSADNATTCPVYQVADNCFKILVDPAISGQPKWWKIILLHEMCHIALWPKHLHHEHGKLFKEEKKRIFLMGALDNLW